MHPTDLVLNDYIDEGLAGGERASVEDHLRSCADCRAVVADLRELRRAASALRPMEPPARAWVGIEQSLRASVFGQAAGSRRSAFAAAFGSRVRVWASLAAAAALVVATTVGYRMVANRTGSEPADVEAPTAQSVEAELRQAEEHYQKAISGLEQIAAADRGALDPNTAATLQKNLAVVDQAIGESRAALRAQPNSEPAQASLLESFKAKLALLENTVALINEMRKGNEAGAAQIVSSLKRGT